MIIPFGVNVKKEYVPSKLNQNRNNKARAISARLSKFDEINSYDKRLDCVMSTSPLTSISDHQSCYPHNMRKDKFNNEKII